MKKIMISGLMLLLVVQVFGGGIVTNSNQSAEYMRTMNRNASTDLDAVYFNPAAVSGFGNGLHLYISNQTILQTRTIESAFTGFNTNPFEGSTFAPLFPNVYIAYVMGNLGISGGLLPIGGGGSAIFEDGLPSFERQIANTGGSSFEGYTLDVEFEGSSIYLGFQGGLSYKLHDMLSVYAGARIITATNTYVGHLKDISFIAGDGSLIPGASVNAGFADILVETEQTGSSMVLVAAANANIGDALNVSVRYETMGELTVVNDTEVDGSGLFTDEAETHADIPAQLSAGLGYHLSEALYVTGTYDLWFNTDVNWGGKEVFVNNGYEAGGALEYKLSDALKVSAGALYAIGGADDKYNKDLSYSLNSTTLAGGGVFALNEKQSVSLGVFNTFYEDGQNFAPVGFESSLETYQKTAIGFAVGYSHSF